MANSFGAKHLLLAAVSLVVGLALGGLAPRSQVRALEAQVSEAGDKKCENTSTVGRDIASVFQGRPWEDGLPEPQAPSPAGGDEAPEDEGLSITIGGDGDGEEAPENLEDSLDMVQEAMEIRQAQAKQALVEAGLDEDQIAEVDDVIADMNDNLAALAEDFVADFNESGGEPNRQDTMLFARDTLDVLIESEDALWNAMDPDQREEMEDAALDPFSYVDGTVVETFMELDQ